MPDIVFANVSKHYEDVKAVDDLSLTVLDGELFVLVGPSGAGKSTLVSILAGTLRPDVGTISIGENKISTPRRLEVPAKRGMSAVFQDGVLWSNMTVRKHLEFVLKDTPHWKQREEIVSEVLSFTRLSLKENSFPDQLSGGEKQRLALARAIAVRNKVLVLDEPFANLDRPLTQLLMTDLVRIKENFDLTILVITHQQEDALFLADRIGIMSGGRIVQCGTPSDIYFSPSCEFVARFFGDNNIIPVNCIDDEVTCELGTFPYSGWKDEKYVICARPTALSAKQSGTGCPAELEEAFFKGEYWLGRLRTKSGNTYLVNFGVHKPAAGSYYISIVGAYSVISIRDIDEYTQNVSQEECHGTVTGKEVKTKGLKKSYGSFCALSDVSLKVAEREFYVLLGPSGAGKTTLVSILNGSLEPDEGSIKIDDETVVGDGIFVPSHKRGLAAVFQEGGLWYQMTVEEHLHFVLEGRIPRHEAISETQKYLRLVKMDKYAKRYPQQLSGGEQQRVSLARALCVEQKVLLLDEPFANLDRPLALGLISDISNLHKRLGLTILLVTHQQEEAFFMADKMGVMKDGGILQEGTPQEIYYEPKCKFVAEFFGDNNIVKMQKMNGKLLCPFGEYEDEGIAGDLYFCVRPSALSATREGNGASARVISSVFRGEYWLARMITNCGIEIQVNFGQFPPEPGEYKVVVSGSWRIVGDSQAAEAARI